MKKESLAKVSVLNARAVETDMMDGSYRINIERSRIDISRSECLQEQSAILVSAADARHISSGYCMCDMQLLSMAVLIPHAMLMGRRDDSECGQGAWRVHGLVARRRKRIVGEEMKEGASFFNVTAVIESFGFAESRWSVLVF
ncbi:hypothetical protein C8R43DRAFT_233967 [Mycena crocata]|nr:hypothetical protein C8R43DRAFT_233967 [Mycena crocata]